MEKDLTDMSEKAGVVERDSLGGTLTPETQDVKSSESSTENLQQDADSGEKEAVSENQEQEPAKQVRRETEQESNFKNLRQLYKETRQERDRERAERTRDRQMLDRYMRELDELKGAQKPKGNELPPDQVQARDQLLDLLMASPKFQDQVLSKLKGAEDFKSQVSERETEQKYSATEQQMAKVCESHGLDLETELQSCHDWLANHPIFSQLYPEGKSAFPAELYEVAFKAINSDRADELAERRANLKSIQERERKRGANSEVSAASLPGGRPMPKRLEDFLEERTRDGIIAK